LACLASLGVRDPLTIWCSPSCIEKLEAFFETHVVAKFPV